MNFYVGQKVVCVKSHSRGCFKQGDIFTIIGVEKKECCNVIAVNIGVFSEYEFMRCICGDISYNDDYYKGSLFRPLQEEKGDKFIEDFLTETVEI